MAKASPWHSVKRDVYHVCTNCEDGNNIEPENRREGDGNKRLCDRCSELIRAGTC